MHSSKILIRCYDEKGLVYKISKLFYKQDLNIESNNEYVDKLNHIFFMRTVVSGIFVKQDLKKQIQSILPIDAEVEIIDNANKNIILFATKESHVLGDILIRHNEEKLNANIQAVISNHNNLKSLVEKFDIPYFYLSTKDRTRDEHEKEINTILQNFTFNYIILAKYMRILTPSFVAKYKHKIINIHHSFLPAFIGANPYKQAYKRGVKIIGASSHFVTENLDEGPIITQDTIFIDHTLSWRDMQDKGKDIEKNVLSKALYLALDDRIFINDNKTIIF